MAMLGGMFGINGDGKVSCMEKVVGYGYSRRSWGNRRRGAGAEYFASRSHSAYQSVLAVRGGREVDDDVFAEVERSVNLIISGLDEDELRLMEPFARYEALMDAGLDPEDYAYLDD